MKSNKKNMTAAVFMISFALMMRQLSMSIVAPFLSPYCRTLAGYTSLTAGLVLGIFGLMQAVFQTPFGMLSDRYGNKRILLAGLLITTAGLLLAWRAHTIYLLVFARALQGCGAITGVGFAWTACLAPSGKKTKSMGILSFMVSAGSSIAFILGPVLRKFMKVNMIFLVCACAVAVVAFYILLFVPDAEKKYAGKKDKSSGIGTLLKDRQFMTVSFSAFLNNFMMMSVFFALPLYLISLVPETELWIIFLPAVGVAFFAMKTAVHFTNCGYSKPVMTTAFSLSTISVLLFLHKESLPVLAAGTVLFFASYSSLIAVIASEVNAAAGDKVRGTANGLFNSLQFFGSFVGAVCIGFIWQFSQMAAFVPVICAGITGIVLSLSLRSAKNTKSME
jgi:MFS family permease